jgi:electron transport complex protein RnfG
MQKKMEQSLALTEVFPQGVKINEHNGTSPLPSKYWTAVNADGSLAGYAFESSLRGYSSDIKCIAGVNPQGKISGLKILSQSETPGLGTRVAEVASKAYLWNSLFKPREKTEPWFQQQFRGLDLSKPISIKTKCAEWHKAGEAERMRLTEENAVTAITGATISTKAVVTSIEKQVSEYFKAMPTEKSEAIADTVTADSAAAD